MHIDFRYSTVLLIALSSAVACGSSESNTATKGNGSDAGDASTGGSATGNGGAPNGGSSNGGASGASTNGGTAGAVNGGASGSSAGASAGGASGAAGTSQGGASAGGAASSGGAVGTGGAPLDGGTLCHRLGECCATAPAPYRPSCIQYASSGTPAQCQVLMGLYCGVSDAGSTPVGDAGASCSDLAFCCPGLGPQEAQCDQVVSAGVAFACAIFKNALCPP